MNEALAQVTLRKCLTHSALDEDCIKQARCCGEEEDPPDTDVVV